MDVGPRASSSPMIVCRTILFKSQSDLMLATVVQPDTVDLRR